MEDRTRKKNLQHVDKELREILHRLAYNQCDRVNIDQLAIDEALQAIEAKIVEARIDEVNRIPYWGTPYDTDVYGYEKLFKENRLTTLKKEKH